MKRLISVLLLSLFIFAGQVSAKTYGSGGGSPSSSSSSDSKKSRQTQQPAANTSKSSSKKYGSGDGTISRSSPQLPSPSSSNTGKKPTQSSGFAGSQQNREEHSTKVYAKANPAPKATYVDARGRSRSISSSDANVSYLRGRLDGERYANRNVRVHSYYGSRYDYYYSRPSIFYNDNYSSPFHYWLLDQSYIVRGDYAYNHRYDMDPVRYALYMNDVMVANRVYYLESINYTRNQYWAPLGWDYDGMLDDHYVTAVYNPAEETPVAYVAPINWPSGHFFLLTIMWLTICVVVVCIIWVIFIRES